MQNIQAQVATCKGQGRDRRGRAGCHRQARPDTRLDAWAFPGPSRGAWDPEVPLESIKSTPKWATPKGPETTKSSMRAFPEPS